MVNGKVRKYYAITDEGRRALEEARPNIAELVGDVLESEGPRYLPPPTEAESEKEPTR